MPRNHILAALLTYRAIYYLVPLAVALVAFAILESRRSRQHVSPTPSPLQAQAARRQEVRACADATGSAR